MAVALLIFAAYCIAHDEINCARNESVHLLDNIHSSSLAIISDRYWLVVSDVIFCHPECPRVSPRIQSVFSESLVAAAAQAPARARSQWHDKTQAPHALRAACLKAS
jgi:hypothetical protein